MSGILINGTQPAGKRTAFLAASYLGHFPLLDGQGARTLHLLPAHRYHRVSGCAPCEHNPKLRPCSAQKVRAAVTQRKLPYNREPRVPLAGASLYHVQQENSIPLQRGLYRLGGSNYTGPLGRFLSFARPAGELRLGRLNHQHSPQLLEFRCWLDV